MVSSSPGTKIAFYDPKSHVFKVRLVALQNDDINLGNLEAIQGTNCLTHFHDMNLTHGWGKRGRQLM